MKVLQKFLNQLTGPAFSDAVIAQMLDHIEDFRESRRQYLAALDTLKTELGEAAHLVDTAIHKRLTAELLFSGYLGLQMNLDHFRNSTVPNCTWPQTDYSDYLREDLSHTLPEYQEANQAFTDLYQSLTETQKKIFNDNILSYDSFLATFAPKLAHYYGYLLGNSLFHWLIPGYHPDAALTYKYNLMLGEYFEKSFLPIEV